MRYSGKRTDSGTANSTTAQPDYDMGARRYGPNTGRFLQSDAFAGALGDLGLALDPLTQNRYALAGGNPISYVETDGHMAIADGGGGGSATPAPPPPPPEPSLKDKAKNLLGGLWNKGKDKVEDKFRDTKNALDELDAKTFDNPDWKLHGVYEGWKKFEEKAEPIVGATDVYNCAKDGGAGDCAMAALAVLPVGKAVKGAKALAGAGKAAEGERVLFGQARISPHFSPGGKVPQLRGRHIEDVANDLRSGKLSPDVFNLRAWREGGQLVSENNRGLATLSLAGKRPQVGVNLTIVPKDQIGRDVLNRLTETNVFGDILPSTRIGVTPSQLDRTLVSPFEIHIP
jgi:RHS repeat-associated protein